MVHSSVGEGRGFLDSNIDVGFLTDPKILKLARRVPDEGELACTILVYLRTVLQSWHDGRRLTAEEAEAMWEPTAERVESLRAIGLIDDEGRVPETAWEKHFGAALARRERRRASGAKGGKASAKARKQRFNAASAEPLRRSSNASAKPQRRSTNGEAAPNLTPAEPPSPKGEAGGSRVSHRAGAAPTRPAVHMDRLAEADTHDLEMMLHQLPEADGRRRALRAELAGRRDAGAHPSEGTDLTTVAESVFAELGFRDQAAGKLNCGPVAEADA